jgi:nucleotide-binding universal stress UspA family protein
MGEKMRGKFPIVVGVDFSEASAYAIQEAVELASRLPGGELNFVHVVPAPSDLHDAHVIDALSERLGRTMAKFEHFVRDVMFVFASAPREGQELAFHVRVGSVSQELHQVAVDADAELIVVGKDRHKGRMRWLRRKTPVDELLRDAHVPVVVANPKDFRGLERSATPEPPRPGQELIDSGITTYSYADYNTPRSVHVSGMI